MEEKKENHAQPQEEQKIHFEHKPTEEICEEVKHVHEEKKVEEKKLEPQQYKVEEKKPEQVQHKIHVKPASSDVDKEKFWKITTGILIVLLAFFLFKQSYGIDQPTTAAVNDPTEQLPDEPQEPERAELSIGDDPVLGDENAQIVMYEFSDYECPFCGRWYMQVMPKLKEKYIKTGKVKLVFKDFPLSFHQMAVPAALAANCAIKEDKFWEMHDKVFTNQESLSEENLKKWAKEFGLNMDKWEECMSDDNKKTELANDMNEGITAGIQGTPAFFINGIKISGARPYEVFEQVIEKELAE